MTALSWSQSDEIFRLSRIHSRLGRTILISVLVGLAAGLTARVLESVLQYGQQRIIGHFADPGGTDILEFKWALLLLPMLGGLCSGLIVGLFCRPTRAHGTAVLVDSFHHFGAELSLRDSVLKALAAVCVISMGGSVGKEAVIAVLSAALGSTIAKLLKLTRQERRLFLIAGCAAGIGAIFQCPLGGALFATTVLYRDLEIEAGALMPAIIASVTSYSIFMAFGGYGHHLLDGTGKLSFTHPVELIAYAGLGIVCAGASILFYYCLEGVIHFRRKGVVPSWLAPAFAGLLVGAIACGLPQVMDAHYQFLQNALDESFINRFSWKEWALLFTLVMGAKCAATGLMIGAESAGGLFGPVLFIGGSVGAATGAFLAAFFPDTFPPTLRHALIPVAMAGVFSASLRTPLAAIVMVTEMTGSYGLIVPLMLVSTVAYVLGRHWGVYPEQVKGPSDSPAHAGRALVSLLENMSVSELMQKSWPFVVKPGSSLPDLLIKVPPDSRPTFAVVQDLKLIGIVSTTDIVRATDLKIISQAIVAVDIMTSDPVVLYADDDIYGALSIFDRYNLDVLPVVTEQNGEFMGMLARSDILRAVRERIAQQREHLLREHSGFSALEREGRLNDMLGEGLGSKKACFQRVKVQHEVVGQSLSSCAYRRRYALHVVAIECANGSLLSPPDPNRTLESDDVLVVLADSTPATPQSTSRKVATGH